MHCNHSFPAFQASHGQWPVKCELRWSVSRHLVSLPGMDQWESHNPNQPSETIKRLPICHSSAKMLVGCRVSWQSEAFRYAIVIGWHAPSLPFTSSGNIRSHCQKPGGREIGTCLCNLENSTWYFLRYRVAISAASNANIVPNMG